ncbi:MAG TPA: ABC transporter permease subunit [Candidatus Acetothermia bacterium]|nr:ABC transporter permease subunit [Candidatus Acetothermia bacterium]
MPGAGRPRRRRSLEHRPILRNVLMYALSVGLLVALWTLASVLIEVVRGRAYLPNPIVALSEVVRLGPMLFRHFWISAWRLVLAILIAFFAGYPLGLLIGHERKLDQLISPMIYLVYPIPQVAFVLLLFIVFGIGEPVKVAIVAIALFFQLLVSARGAAKLIEQEHVTSVLSAGGSRWQIYRHVVLPATLPPILTSLRVSVGLGMAFLYIAETSGPARGGLGVYVKETMVYSPPPAFAGILAMAVLGSCLYLIIEIIERLACRWKYVGRNALLVAAERALQRWRSNRS